MRRRVTPASGTPSAPAHAEAHYKEGWDVIVETRTVGEIEADLTERGITTLAAAIKHYEFDVEIWNERQADARNSAF